jgi:competence ComEA-like helix-hairpin-helix protein
MTERVDINTANAEELSTLPGIGAAMAERIITNRPYETPEDLLSVSGIGPALLESLESQVIVAESQETQSVEDEEVIYLGPEMESAAVSEDAPPETMVADEDQDEEPLPAWDGSEQEAIEAPETMDQVPGEEPLELGEELETQEETETIDEAAVEEGITDQLHKTEEAVSKEKAIIPVEEEEDEKPLQKDEKKPRPVTRGRALFMAAAFSFFAFLLAVLLTLGILGSLNNGLRYASTDQAQAIYRQIEALNSEFSLLNEDIEGLRSRLDNLESLSGRVGELELQAETLSTEMAAIADELQGINDQMAEVMDSAERFQVFLNGLGELLDNLTSAPEPKEVP